MKCWRKSSTMLGWIGIIIIVLSGTRIVHAALIRDTIEVVYLFDEGKGDVIEDSSGNGRDGEITEAKYVKGVFGTCL